MIIRSGSFLVLSFMLMASSIAPARAWNPSAGWKALLGNDYVGAMEEFDKEIAADSGSVEAHVGKAFTIHIYRNDSLALNHLRSVSNNSEVAKAIYPLHSFTIYDVENVRSIDLSDLIGVYKDILRCEKLTPDYRFKLERDIPFLYLLTGRIEEAKKNLGMPSRIMEWQILSRFENFAQGGIDKDFISYRDINVKDTFAGPYNEPISWRRSSVNIYGNVDHSAYCEHSEGVYYAASWFYIPEDQEVLIHLGRSGAVELAVDGTVIYKDWEEKNLLVGADFFQVRLSAGWHSIVCKTANSESQNNAVQVLITDTDYQNITGMKQSADPQDVVYRDVKAIHRVHDDILALQDELAADPENISVLLRLMMMYVDKKEEVKAQHLLKRAKKLYPSSALIDDFLAASYEREGYANEATDIYSQMELYAPMTPIVLKRKIREISKEKEDTRTLFSLISSLDSLKYSSSTVNHLYSLVRKSSAKDFQGLLDEVRYCFERYPYNSIFRDYLLSLDPELSQSNRKQIALLEAITQRYPSFELFKKIADLYRGVGNQSRAGEYDEKALNLNPGNLDLMRDIALGYRNINRMHKSLDKILAASPTHSILLADKGNAYNMQGHIEEALKWWRRSIVYNPYDYDVRMEIANAIGDSLPFRFLSQYDIDSIVANSPGIEEYPNEHFLYPYSSWQIYIYPDGALEMRREYIMKPLTQQGVYDIGDQTPYAQDFFDGYIESAYTRTKDGKDIPADILDGDITFNDLSPGDYAIVNIKFLFSVPSALYGNCWWQLPLEYSAPVLHSEVVVHVPEEKSLKFRVHNGKQIEPVVHQQKGYVRYTFEEENVSAMSQEPTQPTHYDAARYISFSTFAGWGDIAGWFDKATQSASRMDSSVQLVLDSLMEGVDTTDKGAVLSAIAAFVSSEIKDSNLPVSESNYFPMRPSRVLKRKEGSCLDMVGLGIVMARRMGIEAWYTFVSTSGYFADTLLPSTSYFTHCVMTARTDKGDVHIDLTVKNFPFGSLPTYLCDALALEIREGVSRPTRLPGVDPARDSVCVQLKGVVDESGQLTLEVLELYYGASAGTIRNIYQYASEESIKEYILNVNAVVTPATDLEDFSMVNFDNNSASASIFYTLKIPGFFVPSGDLLIGKYPWPYPLTDSMDLYPAERVTPLLQLSPRTPLTQSVVLSLPASFVPDELLSISYSHPDFAYSISTSYHDGVLHTERRSFPSNDLIMPSRYPDFREVLSSSIASDGKPLIFRRLKK